MAERHDALGPWVRLSARYRSDRRVLRASPLAELIWLRGLAEARLQGTDGHLIDEWLPVLGRGMAAEDAEAAAAELVTVGLWEACDDGWQVPGTSWTRWQETEDDYEARRERERVRKAAWREKQRETPA